jgi:kexin
MYITWLYKVLLCLLFSNDTLAKCHNNHQKDHENHDYFVIETNGNRSVENLEQLHPDWKYEHTVDFLDNFHVFSFPKGHKDVGTLQKTIFQSIGNKVKEEKAGSLLKREEKDFLDSLLESNVYGLYPLREKRLEKRMPISIDHDVDYESIFKRKQDYIIEQQQKVAEEFGINDPIFKDQWHIFNVAYPGHDVNVIPVWRMNITGKGVVTALIDDGLDYESADLKDRYNADGSWDFNDNRPNPKPMLSNDYHGTRCAAEIAASKGNNYCGVGVAYDSQVAGIRILSGGITSEEEAKAMVYGLDVNDIYSCSWGPPDNGRSMDAPEKIIRSAILKGIQDGRDGKGALYVFASGNGASRGDGCNFDGYTNSIYSLTVSAIDYKGLHPQYSESCTAVMVTTYSSGSGEHIRTTDINDACTKNHGGTSAAAPLAAGIYALVLEANPELTWRDVQHLTVLSAAEIDPFDDSWQETAIEGRKYSPRYGWGKIDAEKMVNMAMDNWKLLKPQSWYYTPFQLPDLSISKVGEVKDSFNVSNQILEKANFEKIEQITVTVNIKSGRRGDVEVDLISPNGIVSSLAMARARDDDKSGFPNWTFSTVAHWGEDAAGEWTLKVRNVNDGNTVQLLGWQIHFFGESINPDLAKRFDLNEDYSTINNEDEDKDTKSSTTALETLSTTTEHLEDANTATGEVDLVPTSSELPVQTTVDAMPSSTSSVDIPTSTSSPEDQENGNGSYQHKDTSKHYVAYFLGLIVVGLAILVYLIVNRRKPGRARRREDFEFDIIHPDDDESSRFEFDDDEYDDDDDEFNISDFDEDHPNLNSDKLDKKADTANVNYDESSEFDLGTSNLSGYEKSDKILEDARAKERREQQVIEAKQHFTRQDEDLSHERSGLIESDDVRSADEEAGDGDKSNDGSNQRLIV